MGLGASSSCCGGGGGDKDTQMDVTTTTSTNGNSLRTLEPKVTTTNGVSQFSLQELENFKEHYYEGINVHLILQDKTKLGCQVRLDRSHEFILLTCDKKVRAISIKDIKAILHTSEQLKRIESSAGIMDPDACAALHLLTSGNCIPLFFDQPEDKILFVEVTESLRVSAKLPS